jgi:Ca-activated chloride channel homolog
MKLHSNATGLLISLFFLLTMPLFGQSPQGQSSQSSTGDDVIRQSVTIFTLDAFVLDKKTGAVAGGLKATDFNLFENGVQQNIEYFGVDRLPLSVVVVLDVSRSVRPFVQRIAAGGVAAFSKLKPEDEVAVLAFASKTRLVQEFTRDRSLVSERIGRIGDEKELGSGTNLLLAISEASKVWDNAKRQADDRSRRVIVVVSDNLSYVPRGASKTTIEDTKRNLLESDATLCGIVVGDDRAVRGHLGINPLALIAFRSYRMEPFAEETGGEVLTDRKREVEGALSNLFERLRSRYILGYTVNDTRFDGSFRRLKVSLVPTANPEGRLVVKTRTGYWTEKPEPNREKGVID